LNTWGLEEQPLELPILNPDELHAVSVNHLLNLGVAD